MRDAAVLLRGFVSRAALGADEHVVGALGLQMLLQVAPGNLDFLTGSASNDLLGASLTMLSLLVRLVSGTAAVGALDDSVLTLLEDVGRVVLVGNGLQFARVPAAREGGAVEHGLLNRVQLVYRLHALVAVFAR